MHSLAVVILAGAAASGAPTLEELKRATYSGIKEVPGAVALKDGRWEEGHAAVTLAPGFRVTGDLTIRGVTRSVGLDVRYLGQIRSPFDDTRVGFTATTRINRHDFGVSWNAELPESGLVVGDDVLITIDVEGERPRETPS